MATTEGLRPSGHGDWRWPALAMFAVGYGANQFVPLLAVYRRTLGLTDSAATAIFGVYALGLIPGLLVGGWAADRFGRRRLLLGLMALSLLATLVLITGQWGSAGLYVGRLLTGIASGTVFTVGTAWVKELSAAEPPGAGARRAALALTGGFGIGPLVAGVLARFAPAPELLPYLVHLGLAGVATALIPLARETRPAGPEPSAPLRLLPPAVRSSQFRWIVAPMAPWVFGSVTLVFTTLPAHGVPAVPTLGVALPGLLAAVALAAGVAVQGAGRRVHDASPPGRSAAPVLGLGVVAVGCALAAFATARPGLALVFTAAVVLGAGYGLCLISGLREVERIAGADELGGTVARRHGGTVAIFYCLAYSGLVVPFLVALVAPHLGYPAALLAVAGVVGLTAGGAMGHRGLRRPGRELAR